MDKIKVMSSSDDPETVFATMYKALIDRGFDRMKIFVKESRDLMLVKKDQMMGNFKDELENFPDSRELTSRVYSEHFENYDKNFVAILMNSTFTSAYTLFEVTFDKICSFAQARYGLKLSVSDLAGGDIIGKSKKYIEKVAGVNLDSIDKHWIELTDYRKIRNCVVHDSAVVGSDNIHLTKFIRNHKHIEVINPLETGTTTFYIKDIEFVFAFCDLAHDYLSFVLREVIKTKP